jgi:hypothetical protein
MQLAKRFRIPWSERMSRGGLRLGAGRPGWKGKAENCHRVDVRWMRRNGHLSGYSSGTLSYSIGGERVGSIGYSVRSDMLTLNYTLNGEPKRREVPIRRTPCRFGGSRSWLACPHCWRTCAVLYLRRGGFYCRRCAQVSYESQSEDPICRSWRKQQKAEARLEENWRRPKGMHRRTHERLLSVIFACEEAREDLLAAFIAGHARWFSADGSLL